MIKEPTPHPTIVYGMGSTPEAASASLIHAHDPTGGTKVAGFETAGIKKYPHGKTYAWADGPAEQVIALRNALMASVNTTVALDAERFRVELRKSGLSELDIEQALATVRIQDDTWLSEKWPT